MSSHTDHVADHGAGNDPLLAGASLTGPPTPSHEQTPEHSLVVSYNNRHYSSTLSSFYAHEDTPPSVHRSLMYPVPPQLGAHLLGSPIVPYHSESGSVGQFRAALVPRGQFLEVSSAVAQRALLSPQSPSLMQTLAGQNQQLVLIYNEANQSDEEKKEEEEDVSEEFVREFNNHVGNQGNHQKARRLIVKMRQLGGLETGEPDQNTNVPEARKGLCILAQLDHLPFKLQSLDSLQELLCKDKIEKQNASQLVALAILLMNIMNRELLQTETLEVQIKIAQVYSTLAIQIQQHYAKRHISAITRELKRELTNSAKVLKALNRAKHPQLAFNVSCALEGMRRLKDDSEELIIFFERVYHLSAAITSLQMKDAKYGFTELGKVFSDIDPHLSNNAEWYNAVLLINNLCKQALDESHEEHEAEIEKHLAVIQTLIRDKRTQFGKKSWKFNYASLEVLAKMTLHAPTQKIRRKAFEGVEQMGLDFPGLTAFAHSGDHKTVERLDEYITFEPMKHFEKPFTRDPNIRIREACVELLAKVAIESQDLDIRRKARRLLSHRLEIESKKDQESCSHIVEILRNAIPDDDAAKKVWLGG